MLYVGPAADNQPWLEVMVDLADPNVVEVFHAMMLRPSTIAAAFGPLAEQINPEYGPQRR